MVAPGQKLEVRPVSLDLPKNHIFAHFRPNLVRINQHADRVALDGDVVIKR